MWISPNYQDVHLELPLKFDDQLLVFRDRVLGWQLDIADQVINGKKNPDGETICEQIPGAGFATFLIIMSYFEMIAKYRDGYDKWGQSRKYFKRGVKYVFPQLEEIDDTALLDTTLDALYTEVRCGLYHGGLTGKNIILTGELDGVMQVGTMGEKLILTINPHTIAPALIGHLSYYVDSLRDPNNEELRRNFEKRFKFDNPALVAA